MHWTDCGDKNCRGCKPIIEAREEQRHIEAVNRTVLRKSDYSLDDEESSQDAGEAKAVASWVGRSRKQERKRVIRRLTAEQRVQALEMLKNRPVKGYFLTADGGRDAWLSEVWIELENPSETAAPSGGITLESRIRRAVNRAEKRMRRNLKEDPLVLIQNVKKVPI
jgi:hypothetical protein